MSPLIGKAIIRFGERKVLSLEYAGLILVFLSYATVESRWIVAVLYVLDHIFFGFNLAIDSYFQKIAHSPEEITSNLGMAQTINHVSALVVPVLGGLEVHRIIPLSLTFDHRACTGGDLLLFGQLTVGGR